MAKKLIIPDEAYVRDMREQYWHLFRPPHKSYSIKSEYPELNDVEEFAELSNDEMLFVWHHACQSSPFLSGEIIIKSEKERAKASYLASFGKTGTAEESRYFALDFPSHIVSAIRRMQRYSVSSRIRAKQMSERILNQWEMIVNRGVSDPTDRVEVAKFVSITRDIQENLPQLIKTIESGFGIKENITGKAEERGKQPTYMDKLQADIA